MRKDYFVFNCNYLPNYNYLKGEIIIEEIPTKCYKPSKGAIICQYIPQKAPLQGFCGIEIDIAKIVLFSSLYRCRLSGL